VQNKFKMFTLCHWYLGIVNYLWRCYVLSRVAFDIYLPRTFFPYSRRNSLTNLYVVVNMCLLLLDTFSNDLVERLVWASSWRMQPTSPWPSVLDKVMVKIMSLFSFCWCFPFFFLSVEVGYLTWAWVLLNVRLCWSSHIARLN